jgi:hypothetical protein
MVTKMRLMHADAIVNFSFFRHARVFTRYGIHVIPRDFKAADRNGMLNQLFIRHRKNKRPVVVQVVGFPKPGDSSYVQAREVSLIPSASPVTAKIVYRVDPASLNQVAECVAVAQDRCFAVTFHEQLQQYVIYDHTNNAKYRHCSSRNNFHPLVAEPGQPIWI